MAVVDARGKALGKVVTRGNGRFLVERKTLVQEQHIVDDAMVDDVREDVVFLSVDERYLENQSMHDPLEKPAYGSAPNASEPRSQVRKTDVGDVEDANVAERGGITAGLLRGPDLRRKP